MSNYGYEEEEFSAKFNGQSAAADHRAGQAPLEMGGGLHLSPVAVVSVLNSYFTYLGKRIVDEGISRRRPRRR